MSSDNKKNKFFLLYFLYIVCLKYYMKFLFVFGGYLDIKNGNRKGEENYD